MQRAKDAGFDLILLTMQDAYDGYPAWSFQAWEPCIAACTKVGLRWAPWGFLRTRDDCWTMRDLAVEAGQRQGIRPLGCWNCEQSLLNGPITISDINLSSAMCDTMVSTLPWWDLDWHDANGETWRSLRRDIMVELQLFPSRVDAVPGTPSREPRDDRARAYAVGMPFVRWQHGLRDMGSNLAAPTLFPYPQPGTFSLYTGDDVGGLVDPYRPDALPPCIPVSMPALYGPSKALRPISIGPLVREVKRALHRAGFGTFSRPDLRFNRPMEEAVRHLQRYYGIAPTGQIGRATWQALAVLGSAIPGGGSYALDGDAARAAL